MLIVYNYSAPYFVVLNQGSWAEAYAFKPTVNPSPHVNFISHNRKSGVYCSLVENKVEFPAMRFGEGGPFSWCWLKSEPLNVGTFLKFRTAKQVECNLKLRTAK